MSKDGVLNCIERLERTAKREWPFVLFLSYTTIGMAKNIGLKQS